MKCMAKGCEKGDRERPAIYRGEPWCSEQHMKEVLAPAVNRLADAGNLPYEQALSKALEAYRKFGLVEVPR